MTSTNKLRSFERSEAAHGIKEQEPVAERAWFTISELNAWADKKLAEKPIKEKNV